MIWILTLLLMCLPALGQAFTLNDPAIMGTLGTTKRGLISSWALDETSGTRFDRKGLNNFSVLIGTPGFGVGTVPFNNYITFTAASSQAAQSPNSASLQTGGSDFGIAVWINLVSSPAFAPIITKGNDSGTDFEYYLFMDSGSAKPRFQIKDTTAATPSALWGSVISLATWHLVVATYDSANTVIGISVDGGAFVTTPAVHPTVSTTHDVTIGRYFDGATYFNGKMDELNFWKRALTANDVARLWNNGNGRVGLKF